LTRLASGSIIPLMKRPHRLILGALIANASMAMGCAQVLGDFELEPGSTGSTSSSGTTSSGAGGSSGVAATSSGSGSSSSGTASGGIDPCGMGSVTSIQDDFDDNATGSEWESYTNDNTHIIVEEKNGTLVITTDGFAPTGSEGPFAGYRSKGSLRSLIGCTFSVEVKEAQTMFAPIAVRMELVKDDDPTDIEMLRFSQVGPRLVFHNYIGGTDVSSKGIDYDPTAHRWWRFREEKGEIHSETSPDGKMGTWTSQFQIPTPDFVDTLRVNLTMGAKQPSEPGGRVVFDNLNLPPPP
jgi:hypothetical protein